MRNPLLSGRWINLRRGPLSWKTLVLAIAFGAGMLPPMLIYPMLLSIGYDGLFTMLLCDLAGVVCAGAVWITTHRLLYPSE